MGSCTTFLAVLVALLSGLCAYCGMTPAVAWYRLSTSALSVYALLTLPKEHVDDFLESYKLFEQEMITGTAKEHAQIVDYYKVVNHLCAIGEVEKMYIPPVMDLNQGIFANQMLWEEKGMADKLDLGPGKRVLDVGCGRGRIAHHVATYTGAHVTGLNIDNGQIKFAKDYAIAKGLLNYSLDFKQGNYNEPLPFENETFDAMYHVQALTYVTDLTRLLKEINRVLKPGAKVSFLDWFVLPAYDASDAHHRFLMAEVKAVLGAVWSPLPSDYEKAFAAAGFEVLFSGEASEDGGHQWPLVKKAETFYLAANAFVKFLTNLGLIPGHVLVLMDRLSKGGESFIEADQKSLFTTSWQFVAQKK